MELSLADEDLARLRAIADGHPEPLVFATVSGAHLYGFPSADSDWDLRGAHVLPLRAVVGLDEPTETIERMEMVDGIELDLVTHDIRKFLRMLVKPNGYVLEQVLSPLVVRAASEHAELRDLARRCITRHHGHHYAGFARNQKRLFDGEAEKRVKPLLYIYRVLLTGIHLMQEGELCANLPRLNEKFGLSFIPELIERKVTGAEKAALPEPDLAFHDAEFARLFGRLEEAQARCRLPERCEPRAEVDALLRRLRLGTLGR